MWCSALVSGAEPCCFIITTSRDGRLLASTTAAVTTLKGGAADAAAAKPGLNVFSQYVKTHFASVKKSLPVGTPHKNIMSRIAADYKQQKGTEQVQLQEQLQNTAAVTTDTAGHAEVVLVIESPVNNSSSQQQLLEEEEKQAADDCSGLLSFMDRLALEDA
jgi:hypothetical protein